MSPTSPGESDPVGCTSLGPPPEPPLGLTATPQGDDVCLGSSDFGTLLLYLEEVTYWSDVTYRNCKEEEND